MVSKIIKKVIKIVVVIISLFVFLFSVLFIVRFFTYDPHNNVEPIKKVKFLEKPYYLEDPSVRLEKLTGDVSTVDSFFENLIAILGFSEYPLIIEKDGGSDAVVTVNQDGTEFVAAVEQDGESVLFYSDGEEIKSYTEPSNIGTSIIETSITETGEAILFATGRVYSDNCSLKILKDGEITVLTEKLSYIVNTDFPVFIFWNSDDGNSIIWYQNYNKYSETSTAYLYKDGKSAPLGDNIDISGITDNTDMIYYEQDDKFYVQNGFDYDSRVLIAEADEGSTVRVKYYNKDYSQIIYSVYGEDITQIKNYYYEYGKKPVFLADGLLNRETPVFEEDIDDLKGCYYTVENDSLDLDVYYFGDTFERVFEKQCVSVLAFSGTNNILYNAEDNLYLYDSLRKESVSVFDKTNITTYTATPDLSEIYINRKNDYNDLEALYYVNQNSENTIISDNVIDSFIDGETLFYITEDYELYSVKNGKSEKIYIFIQENVIDTRIGKDLSGYYFVQFVKKDDNSSYFNESDFYISTDCLKFLKIYE
jgi:hypothetical protein